MELFKLPASKIKELFLKKKMSAVEIADYFVKRIEKHDPKIQAFIEVLENRLQTQAQALDQKLKNQEPLGKLAGIPVAIKNIIHIKDVKTTCGSKIMQNYKAPFSASTVQLLEAEDALTIGTTNLDEFAMGSSTENSAFFPTRNPWNTSCVPGGSSGGSAAAVAARLSPIALGTDTGGSIRQPASFCGIVGFKPTYGRVSRYGMVAFASSFDQIGPMAFSTRDIALTMEVLGRNDPKDSTSLDLPPENFSEHIPSSLKNFKIGLPKLDNLTPEVKQNLGNSLKHLEHLGAEIIEIDLDILKYAIAVYYILAPAEASTNLARFDGIRFGHRSKKAGNLEEIYGLSRDEGFGAEVKRRILIGTYVLSSGHQDAFYKKAQKVRNLMISAFDKAFENCDLIAMPTTPSSAFEIGGIPAANPLQMYLEDLFTVPVNIAGLPAISLPSGFDSKKKPLGIQLIGPQMHDSRVIQAAIVYEKYLPQYFQIPPTFNQE